MISGSSNRNTINLFKSAMVNIIEQVKQYKKYTILVIVIVLISACKQDMARIDAMLSDLNLPDQSGKNIELQYSEDGKLKRIFKSPLMERYNVNEDEYYLLFPEGIRVEIFNDSLGLESTIDAGYAQYHSDTEIWEASDSVMAKRLTKNEQLNTDKLYWDQKKKIIYSYVFTKIINEDGIFIGENGFEADDELTYYNLKGASGTVNINDEEEEQ